MKINLLSHWQRGSGTTLEVKTTYEGTGNVPRHALIKTTYCKETSSKLKDCSTPELSFPRSVKCRELSNRLMGLGVVQ